MQGSSSRGAPPRRSADAALIPEEVVSECLWFQVSAMNSSKGCAGCVITIMAFRVYKSSSFQGVEVGSADWLQQLNLQHILQGMFGLANGPVIDQPS